MGNKYYSVKSNQKISSSQSDGDNHFFNVKSLTPVAGTIFIGGSQASGISVKQYTQSGDEVLTGGWQPINAGGTALSLASDSQKNIIVGLSTSINNSRGIRKYNPLGTTNLWSKTFIEGKTINGLAVDSQDNVIAVGNLVSQNDNLTVLKYNSSGTLLWSKATNNTQLLSVAVDSNDNIIVVGERDPFTNITTQKYDPDGNSLWAKVHGETVTGVAVDSNDNVITMGNRNSSNINLRKYNSAGTQLWTADGDINGRSVVIDSNDNIISVSITSTNTRIKKYSPSGTELWEKVVSIGTQWDVAIDENDFIYITGVVSSSLTTRKYDQDGNQITNETWPINFGANTRAIILRK
jgi:hypothetical protein